MRAYVIIGAALALAITPAIAGSKGGDGASTIQNHPQENTSLSYGKTEHTYTEQKASRDAASGKVKFKEFTIKKTTDTASPSKTSGSGKGSADGPRHNYDLKANKGG